MDQGTNYNVLPQKRGYSFLKIGITLVLGLIIGSVGGYFIRENSFKNLRNEITQLEKEKSELESKVVKSTSSTPVSTTTAIKYGVKIPFPKSLGDLKTSETIIPLGTTGNYTVKSYLFSSDLSPNITILASTDAIVYENFIRTGTQAITPNPNTLTPGNPLIMNGPAFCPALSSKNCKYDEETNTALFEKEYTDSKNNPYTVWGAVHFFPVSQSQIGKTAAVVITRVTSNNQQLIDWAREIAINSKK